MKLIRQLTIQLYAKKTNHNLEEEESDSLSSIISEESVNLSDSQERSSLPKPTPQQPFKDKSKHRISTKKKIMNETEFMEKHYKELQYLAKVLEQIRFFQERKMNNEQELIEIAKNILLEEFSSNDIIIEFQEEGDKFYIILDGTAAVYVPNYLEVPQEERDKRQKMAN